MAHTLTEPQRRLIQELLKVGRWNNESEIVRYGLHLVAKEVETEKANSIITKFVEKLLNTTPRRSSTPPRGTSRFASDRRRATSTCWISRCPRGAAPLITGRRIKTDNPFRVRIPVWLAEELRMLPPVNAEYFFWDGEIQSESVAEQFRLARDSLRDQAGVRTGGDDPEDIGSPIPFVGRPHGDAFEEFEVQLDF